MQSRSPAPEFLSIVIPALNEAENLTPLSQRLLASVRPLGLRCEIIIVDDGSQDATAATVRHLSAQHPEIRLLRLSRNFGHQAALLAGMEHARGDAVVTLDADLQHPPELLPELVSLWQAGFDVVQTIRRDTADAGAAKRGSSRGFYRVLSAISRIRVTPGAADFRLLSRAALDAFLACRERCRFNRGLVQWIGFSYCEVPYDAAARHAGRTKYSWRSMLRLAGDAIFSFSSFPLRIAGLAGAAVSLAAVAYLVFALWAALFTDRVTPGWTSILATVLVLGGVQLMVLWILGEYIGRLYEEAKQRPLYIVRPEPPAAQRPEPRRAARSAATLAAESSRPEPEAGVGTRL